MYVTGADSRSEPAGLPRTIIRRALALGKALGSHLYLISVALIAVCLIGVFFGVGFLGLIHRSETRVSGTGADGTELDASLAGAALVPPAATTEPAPILQPGSPARDPSAWPDPALPEPAQALSLPTGDAAQTEQGDSNAPVTASVEQGAAETGAAPSEPEPDRSAAPSPPQMRRPTPKPPHSTVESSHSKPSRKPHHRRSSSARKGRPHTPVRGMEDLLERLTN